MFGNLLGWTGKVVRTAGDVTSLVRGVEGMEVCFLVFLLLFFSLTATL